MLSRLLPPPFVSIVFLISFLAYVVSGNAVFGNPDVPWHLAAGDLIRQTGALPATNAWSFDAQQTTWYNLSWAWDVIISWVASVAGISGLYIFSSLCGAVVIATLGYTMQQRKLVSDLYILLTLAMVWYVQFYYLYAEPWFVTILLTVLFHHLLHLSRSRGFKSLVWLPLLTIVWANMHGGFIVGLSLIALYAIEAQQTRQWIWLKELIVIGAVCTLAALINPYHVHVITGILRTMHSVITTYLSDWHPITFGNETGFTMFVLLFLICSNIRDPRVPVADKLVTFAWLLYALHTRRNFIIFAGLGAFYFAYSMEQFARYAQAAQGIAFKTIACLVEDTNKARMKWAGVVFAALLAIASPLGTSNLIAPAKLDADYYHVEGAIKKLLPIATNVHFINDYNLGGSLAYVSKGKWPLFVDGRAGTAYSEDILQDTITFSDLDPGFEKIFDLYHANGVIVLNTRQFAQAQKLSPFGGWKLVYSNDFVSAYVRGNVKIK